MNDQYYPAFSRRCFIFFAWSVFFCGTGTASVLSWKSVLPQEHDPTQMMTSYLCRLRQTSFTQWQKDYENRESEDQIATYQKDLREKFSKAVGGFPQRTALNAKITGEVFRDGFRVEKIIFESQPNHYVTGALFLPTDPRFSPPYPGVLVVCGHATNGKTYESYQKVCGLLALNGMAAFIFDPIEQGERCQVLDDNGKPIILSVRAHTMFGMGSILLGRNAARFFIWDGMRSIDYLQSRPDIDPQRIGCTGSSGGGMQTSYLMALDDRIVAAAPSCYLTSMYSSLAPQDSEQNIFGQLAFGMGHADYLMMQAPKPTLICAATKDFFDIKGTWQSFRYAKRLYSRLGFAERIDILENDDWHNYARPQREAVARWMSRWLLDKDDVIIEPEIEVLSDQEIQCTPQGQMMLLPGARSTYDLNLDYEKELAKRRQSYWSQTPRSTALDQVRSIAGIRKLTELPEPEIENLRRINRAGYHV